MGNATFSATVKVETRLYAWKTKPTWLHRKSARKSSFCAARSCLKTSIFPVVGLSMPLMMFRSEVFPEPEGPQSATNWPGSIVRFMSFSTGTSISSIWYALQSDTAETTELFVLIIASPQKLSICRFVYCFCGGLCSCKCDLRAWLKSGCGRIICVEVRSLTVLKNF